MPLLPDIFLFFCGMAEDMTCKTEEESLLNMERGRNNGKSMY